MARQHNNIPISAQLRRGDPRPQMPIANPIIAIIAAGHQKNDRPAPNRPSTTDATVPPIAIIAARRASTNSAVEAGRGVMNRGAATGIGWAVCPPRTAVAGDCSTTIALSGWPPAACASARTGGRPSISGCSANGCPHFQQRLTAPRSSSPHFEQRTAIGMCRLPNHPQNQIDCASRHSSYPSMEYAARRASIGNAPSGPSRRKKRYPPVPNFCRGLYLRVTDGTISRLPTESLDRRSNHPSQEPEMRKFTLILGIASLLTFGCQQGPSEAEKAAQAAAKAQQDAAKAQQEAAKAITEARSEEHTSELQSLRHLVCRLLLEKKK